MKKLLSVALVSVLVLTFLASGVMAAETIKLGKAEYAAHGNKCFTVAVVALEGDTIVAAYLDEYQFMPRAEATGVPNSDELNGFAANYANPDQVLGSKKVNNEYYSANMAKAGSTVSIADNFVAIENFVTGKTIGELESILASHDKAEMVDIITGATVVDADGYVAALLAAAKDAQ